MDWPIEEQPDGTVNAIDPVDCHRPPEFSNHCLFEAVSKVAKQAEFNAREYKRYGGNHRTEHELLCTARKLRAAANKLAGLTADEINEALERR